MGHSNGTAITLSGKPFHIHCPQGQEHNLYAAAEFVEQKIRAITQNGRILSFEGKLTLAALNMAHEHLAIQKQIATLESKIQGTLAYSEESSLETTSETISETISDTTPNTESKINSEIQPEVPC